MIAPGKPKAHFSLRRGTSSPASCAISDGWKRCCEASTPHPFQCGLLSASTMGAPEVGHCPTFGGPEATSWAQALTALAAQRAQASTGIILVNRLRIAIMEILHTGVFGSFRRKAILHLTGDGAAEGRYAQSLRPSSSRRVTHQSIVTLAEAGTQPLTKSLHLTAGQAKELNMALVQADARQRHGRLDSLADALMQILLHSDCRRYLDAAATASAGAERRRME